MLAQILLMLGQAISAVIGWFAALVSGELWTLIFSMIVMALVARFIIFPFLGGYISGTVSDSVKSARGLETSQEAQARCQSYSRRKR